MAADSALLFLLRVRFFRNVTVDLTFLIQWQNEVASGLDLILF